MFYVVFVTRLPGCSISGVSRVNSCSVSAGFQVFLKQSFHFLRVRGIDDADTGIVDVDVLMPHAVDLPRFMYDLLLVFYLTAFVCTKAMLAETASQ